MKSFTSIRLDDIKEFLVSNDLEISDNPHLDAWNFIKNNDNLSVPSSIADFFLASELAKSNLPKYKLSHIISSDDNILNDINISDSRNLTKERIIRILGYLNKLENDMTIFNMLPSDISQTMVNKLDIHSIQLICEISNNFSKFCRVNLQPLLRQALKGNTKLNINNYNMKQLLHLNKLPIKTISNYQSLALKEGKLYSGDDQIHDLEDIIQLEVSNNHVLVLTAEGEVYSFGSNNYGQLGLKHNFDQHIPQLIEDIDDIVKLSVSNNNSLILTAEQKVYSFGKLSGNNPILVSGNIIQIACGDVYSLLLNNEGKVYILNQEGVNVFYEDSYVTHISNGTNHSLILNNKGQVYVYGHNEKGQLGLGKDITYVDRATAINFEHVVHIVAGDGYSLVLQEDGSAYEFGIKGNKINYLPVLINL